MRVVERITEPFLFFYQINVSGANNIIDWHARCTEAFIH